MAILDLAALKKRHKQRVEDVPIEGGGCVRLIQCGAEDRLELSKIYGGQDANAADNNALPMIWDILYRCLGDDKGNRICETPGDAQAALNFAGQADLQNIIDAALEVNGMAADEDPEGND